MTQKTNANSFWWAKGGCVVACISCFFAIVVVGALWMTAAREEMAISADVGRMIQIRSAVNAYAELYKCSPFNAREVTVSWRVELLQFGDYESAKLYAQYNRTQHWNSSENARVLTACPRWWCSDTHSVVTNVLLVADVGEGRQKGAFVAIIGRVQSLIEWTRPADMTRKEFRQWIRRSIDNGSASARQRIVIMDEEGKIRTVTLIAILEDSEYE